MNHNNFATSSKVISDEISEAIQNASERSKLLTSLYFDTAHCKEGYNIRLSFDFNILRVFLFPLLDGAYGSRLFYTSLFANSFFFSHNFHRLLLQPYLLELDAFIKFCHRLVSGLTTKELDESLNFMRDLFPYIRHILDSQDFNLPGFKFKQEVAVKFVGAVNDGVTRFMEMKDNGAFPSIQSINLGAEIDPNFRNSEAYNNILDRLREEKIKRLEIKKSWRNLSGTIKLTSQDETRIAKDSEAIFTICELNKAAVKMNSKEMIILVTEDESVRKTLDAYNESFLHTRVETKGIEKAISICRNTDYLALYLILYDNNADKFLQNIISAKNMLDKFLLHANQLNVAILRQRFQSTIIPEDKIENIEVAYNEVKGALHRIDTSTLLEKSGLLDAPGVQKAFKHLKTFEYFSSDELRKLAAKVINKQADLSEWFQLMTKELEIIIRELEITLAHYGISFNREMIGFYYPILLSSRLPRQFISKAKVVLQLLSEVKPAKTAEAVRIIHELFDKYESIPDTYLLMARAYHIQGLSKQGLDVMRELLNDSETDKLVEFQFATSLLCKRVASFSDQPSEQLIKEAFQRCINADLLSHHQDPRIIREIGFLHWLKFDRDKKQAMGSGTGNEDEPILPNCESEYKVISNAIKYAKRSKWLISTAKIKYSYDTAPLLAIILNDLAYFRYLYNFGKLTESDMHAGQKARFTMIINKGALKNIYDAIEIFEGLDNHQKATILPGPLADTLAQILLAKYDLLRSEGPVTKNNENKLRDILEASANLACWYIEWVSESPHSRKLVNKIAKRLATFKNEEISPNLKSIIKKLRVL